MAWSIALVPEIINNNGTKIPDWWEIEHTHSMDIVYSFLNENVCILINRKYKDYVYGRYKCKSTWKNKEYLKR